MSKNIAPNKIKKTIYHSAPSTHFYTTYNPTPRNLTRSLSGLSRQLCTSDLQRRHSHLPTHTHKHTQCPAFIHNFQFPSRARPSLSVPHPDTSKILPTFKIDKRPVTISMRATVKRFHFGWGSPCVTHSWGMEKYIWSPRMHPIHMEPKGTGPFTDWVQDDRSNICESLDTRA